MRAWLGVIGLFLLVGACSKNPSSAVSANNIIEYHVNDNEYSVVLVRDGGISKSEAKQVALKKAAEMAQKHDCRYFTVESEGEVQATHTSGDDHPKMPSNLYYEMIQSDNFGREQFEGNGNSVTQIYPAYRIIFKVYKEKPSRSAIDACTLVKCK